MLYWYGSQDRRNDYFEVVMKCPNCNVEELHCGAGPDGACPECDKDVVDLCRTIPCPLAPEGWRCTYSINHYGPCDLIKNLLQFGHS